jgi:hypothetical protein
MTRMSGSHAVPPSEHRGKLWQSRSRSPLARAVHADRWIVGGLLSTTLGLSLVGCVFPPSLQVADDAGVNAPPAILAVLGDQAPLPEPGPVSVERGDAAGSLRVSLIDADVDDQLYVRIFVDYNVPDRLPARIQCAATPNKTAFRTATCSLPGLCMTSDIGVQRNMTIVVFDRPPHDSGADPQGMPDGGLSTYRFYFLKCQPPQTP